jgi:hypothetical protein
MNDRSGIYKAVYIIAILSLFFFFFGTFMVRIWSPDFWWHLATGKWIVEHSRLLDHDPFSFATLQKDPYFPIDRVRFILTQSWLSQIIIYKIYTFLGFAGISIMRALILTLSLFVLFLLLRYYRMEPAVIVIAISGAYLILRLFTNEKPQLFSILFSSLLLYILERARNEGPRFAILSIPLMTLWSNLHGGYIYGGVIIWIYIISGWLGHLIKKEDSSQRKRHIRFTIILILSFLASFANPNKFYAYVNVLIPKYMVVSQFIQEHRPTYTAYRENIVFFIILSLSSCLLIINRKKVTLNDLFLFVFNVIISLMSVRYLIFFAIYGSFILGRYLNYTFRSLNIDRKRLFGTATILTTITFFTLYLFVIENINIRAMFRTSISYGLYPYGATEFIKKTLPPRRLFNPYTWGGFLIWHLYPKFQVFTDGRNLNPEIFFQYMEVTKADTSDFYFGLPKWEAILEGYNIDYILIGPFKKYSNALKLNDKLVGSDKWELVYAGKDALVFIRKKDEFRDIIKRYSIPKEFAYSTVAAQALERANRAGAVNEKKNYYLIATDAFVRLNKMESAKYTLRKAFEIAPEDVNVKEWIETLGLEKEFEQ